MQLALKQKRMGKKRKCMKCGKKKSEKDGFLKLGAMYFCCKVCCKKKPHKKNDPKICEFC